MNNNDIPEFLGVAIDPRNEEQVQKDWKHEELAGSTPIVWFKKDKYRFFSKRNQAYSSSCMAQSGVKMLGIENHVEEGTFIEFSAKPVYKSRTTPGGGMTLHDSLGALCKPLACLESQLNSQGINETEINESFETTPEMQEVAKKYHAEGFITFSKPNDIDSIATIIDQGKAVQLMLYFLGHEYWQEVPEISDYSLKWWEDRASRHGVAATDYTMYKGKKALIIEDSAGNSSSIGNNGQRILTEQFFTERCYGAGYVLPRKNLVEKINRLLRRGMKGPDVGILQKILRDKGYFPKTQTITNNFASITERSVRAFQKDRGLIADGICGPKTQAELLK